ncbi:hypothetical protein JRO89_XS04G0002000 [Xanthoceras sorbifolium]|uniref:Uncharacterized protein n=1 Tax=Xanthoceras sorbifolium TaxID=99658 RepID=A0ABQ8I3I1_9ROSI|nr:hypothetical protein JRO89_XS04G0002000 [Xanthoceras sorbifolium]
MSVSGLTGSPSRCLRIPTCGSGSSRRISTFTSSWESKQKIQLPRLERCYWAVSGQECRKPQTYLIKCAMDASFGDLSDGSAGNI